MDKENGSGGSSKHKNNSRQPTIDVNDPSSLLNAASLFGKNGEHINYSMLFTNMPYHNDYVSFTNHFVYFFFFFFR